MQVRKFVQISASKSSTELLANDGTIWIGDWSGEVNEWRCMGFAPQIEIPEIGKSYKGELK